MPFSKNGIHYYWHLLCIFYRTMHALLLVVRIQGRGDKGHVFVMKPSFMLRVLLWLQFILPGLGLLKDLLHFEGDKLNKTGSPCSRILHLIKGNKTDTDKSIKSGSEAVTTAP